MAVKPHGLANRPGEPYPATFRIQWTGRGIEPRSPGCRPGIFPLDEPPMSLAEVRPGIEPSLPLYRSGVRPQHLQTKMFSQCSDPVWNRTITFLVVAQASSPLDHGIKLSVTEVGVEPTGTRLSTSSLCRLAYPVIFQ